MQVLIAEDFARFRELIVNTVETNLHVKPVCVSDGFEAVEKAIQLQPELVLLDIGLPGLNGIDAAREILKISPHSKILFVSMLGSPAVVEEALRNGHGYILKTDAALELMKAINIVMQGERFVSRTIVARLPGSSLTPSLADETPL